MGPLHRPQGEQTKAPAIITVSKARDAGDSILDFLSLYPIQDAQEAIITASKARKAGEGSTPRPSVLLPAAAQRTSTVIPHRTDRVPTPHLAAGPATCRGTIRLIRALNVTN